MKSLFDKILEVAHAGIVAKQKSVTRLFPTFNDRVKKIKSNGGLKLIAQKADYWKFKVHSGTKSGTWYAVYLRFKDIESTIHELVLDRRLWVKAGDKVDLRKLAHELMYSNALQVDCSCPADLYWGKQYIRSLGKYDAKFGDKETRPPVKRNPKQYGMVCKHLQALFDAYPFYEGTMAKWIRTHYGKIVKRAEDLAAKEYAKFKAAGVKLKGMEDERAVRKVN